MKVALRSIPTPTPAELEYGVLRFLDQLVDELREHSSSGADIGPSAARRAAVGVTIGALRDE